MIAVVEDDKSIRDLMIYTLNSSGFDAHGYNDGTEFLEAMSDTAGNVELVMLDIMLPGADGIEILKKLKSSAATRDIPVIMETARGTEFDKVIGLDMGADDYLTKPFGMMEMIARVKAVLRRSGQNNGVSDKLTVGEICINTIEHKVYAQGNEVNLTLKEFELLQHFMQNLGRVFTRENLLSSVWGVEYLGETRTVDVHIGTLRTKLGNCGNYIETVRGVGYRMIDK